MKTKTFIVAIALLVCSITAVQIAYHEPSHAEDTFPDPIVREAPADSCETVFYDGEGNPIPCEIVQMLVTSQFVHMQEEEIDSINKYFYVTK